MGSSQDPFSALLQAEAGFGRKPCSELYVGLKLVLIPTGTASLLSGWPCILNT